MNYQIQILQLPRCSPHKYRELIKIIRKYDSRFKVHIERGKGSHRMIYHPDILGKPVSFPIICHGEGDEINKNIVSDLIRAFALPDGLL